MLINSPKVATYDLKPEMSAYEVTDALLGCIAERQIRCDYPQLCKLRHGWPYRCIRRCESCCGSRGYLCRKSVDAMPLRKWAAWRSLPQTTAMPTRCMSRTVLRSRRIPRTRFLSAWLDIPANCVRAAVLPTSHPPC